MIVARIGTPDAVPLQSELLYIMQVELGTDAFRSVIVKGGSDSGQLCKLKPSKQQKDPMK